MAASGGVWAPVAMRLLRSAAANASKAIRHTFPNAPKLQPTPIRSAVSTGRHPIHPAALLRQRRSARWSSTKAYQHVQNAARRWMSSGNTASAGPRFNRAKFPTSNTSRRVAQGTGRAPFASTLRPNLTGGTLCRTQGGYSTGGGTRYFSHTPAAPAQVVQNVGVAMRAFFLSGQKARFDGLNERGDKRYRAVSTLEHEAGCRMAKVSRFEPGSFVDFQLSPTVTALSPLAAAFPFPACATEDGVTLNRDGFLDVLSEDFGRALKDLTAVFADLKRLAMLGDLPVTLEKSNVIRVRFPGVDAATAERLCDDVGLQRGAVYQDPEFDANGGVQVALKFPFAPDSQASEKTMTSPGGTLRSLSGLSEAFDDAFVDAEMAENPWLSDPEGYESMSPPPLSSGTHCSQEFDGLEGIYRFMEECDRAKGRY